MVSDITVLVGSLLVPALAIDEHGRITAVNDALAGCLELSASELVGSKLAGRIVDAAAFPDFLSAAALLHHEHRDCRFVLVGNDLGKLEWSRARINQLGLDGIVQIITGCSHPETIYPALDAYVCTSESEGLSNVLLEAMACGKPIVATRVGGNPEAIQDEIQGILVPPYSPEATVAALKRLISNPGLRHCMGAAGRTRVERHFSLAAMVRAHEELYTELLSGNLHRRASAMAAR